MCMANPKWSHVIHYHNKIKKYGVSLDLDTLLGPMPYYITFLSSNWYFHWQDYVVKYTVTVIGSALCYGFLEQCGNI
jgi:hypothetical protein